MQAYMAHPSRTEIISGVMIFTHRTIRLISHDIPIVKRDYVLKEWILLHTGLSARLLDHGSDISISPTDTCHFMLFHFMAYSGAFHSFIFTCYSVFIICRLRSELE